jgi:hypothetical protein
VTLSHPNRIDRARALLRRPGAWLDETPDRGAYPLRLGPDRRARIVLTLDETGLRDLIEAPGLRPRPGGGWTARGASASAPSAPGRPGFIAGERLVTEPDGRQVARPANLGESPILWLARRRDAAGRPYLTPAEAAAGERLRQDAQAAMTGPSLTMRWDALPRSGSGLSVGAEPPARALSAASRLREALSACDSGSRAMVERICLAHEPLQVAERALGLRRRAGKAVLKRGLQTLARHYRLI